MSMVYLFKPLFAYALNYYKQGQDRIKFCKLYINYTYFFFLKKKNIE